MFPIKNRTDTNFGRLNTRVVPGENKIMQATNRRAKDIFSLFFFPLKFFYSAFTSKAFQREKSCCFWDGLCKKVLLLKEGQLQTSILP